MTWIFSIIGFIFIIVFGSLFIILISYGVQQIIGDNGTGVQKVEWYHICIAIAIMSLIYSEC